MKPLHKIFPVDIYKRGLLMFFGSEEDLKKYIHKNYPCFDKDVKDIEELFDETPTLAVTVKTGTDVIVYAKDIPTVPTLCHEMVHVVFEILRQVSIAPTTCDEAYAYLYEYLIKEVFDWLNVSCDVPSQLCSDDASHKTQL